MSVLKRAVPIGLAAALALGSVALNSGRAQADYQYTAIPQSGMTLLEVDSVETSGEGSNGPGALALDGDINTYWHTKWLGGKDPLPHHITVKLSDTAVALGRVRLTPRQSSTGSGRVNAYELHTANGDCTTATYTKVAEGSFPGDVATYAQERAITLDAPVQATCAKVVYLSAWGGNAAGAAVSPSETVASLAEFNADTAVMVDPTGTPTVTPTTTPTTNPPVIVVPAGAVELVDGTFKVRLHPAFPQVVDYRLGTAQLAGRLGAPLTSILVNEVAQTVTVAAPVKAADGKSASYALTFPNLAGVSMKAVVSVADGTMRFALTDLVDPGNAVNRVRIPDHNLVSVTGDDAAAQLTAGMMHVNRNASADRFEKLSATAAGGVQGSWMVVVNNSVLAAGFDTNATEDNTAGGTTASRVQAQNNRYQRQITTVDGVKVGAAYAGTWTWLGSAAETVAGATLGRDKDPYVEVKITADANADSVVDWQDGAIATRDIVELGLGAEDVPNQVISRIPFNIVSQATHPFLRTLDDTKRISLATDNLAQKVLLKGYQSEGHDAAHPDYAGHYNDRAGGLEDLKTLVNEGEDWNSTFGVHVNATESYSEAKAFSEDLLRMPPQKAWGWMNQSYYIDGPKDLATENVLERFQQFRDEVPANLSWLYMDVYYPYGWEMERLADELKDQGWGLASEWSDRFPMQTTWSHWSQEENYGGSTNKGVNSQLIRFVHNSDRDTWNPHPILSNSNLVDFEGWTGHTNYNGFINNVWQRNLPVKFLQQSDIVKWEANKITFANGTVATSPLTTIPGSVVPTDREITYDGATVYSQGKYLFPWTDGGSARLYHYNTAGGSSTWDLTDAWASQTKLTLFKLTDTGRVKVADVTPSNGSITLEAEAGTAYVLYPATSVPAAKTPNWGQASHIKDPGFFSTTLDAYTTTGDVTIEKTDRANYQAKLGDGAASLGQTLNLPAGTWSAWAWVEIQPGQQRAVTVEASGTGVTKAGYATGVAGKVTNSISASNVMNATASDEKLRTNFQRVRVTFTSTGQPVTFTVRAGEGTAPVRVDDLRVVEFVPAVDTAPVAGTVFFDDFENVDTGYWPFATGSTNVGGDARTQLARLHAPYSQKGWWGVDLNNAVVQGGKLNDNVLAGNWSLMANNENAGEILKTPAGALPFKAGHKYEVSFDYQTTYADQYRVRVGKDVASGAGFATTNVVTNVLPETRTTTKFTAEFTADSCDPFFLAVDKLAGANTQHNMTIDNLRVVDKGVAADVTCVLGAVAVEGGTTIRGGEVRTVTTTVTSLEAGDVTGVTHNLVVPEGWEKELLTAGATTLSSGEASTATWIVRVPATASSATLTLDGSATIDGEAIDIAGEVDVMVIAANEKYLSDMQDQLVGTPTNGWGPVEWDSANGESEPGDGTPLSLGGTVYPKGIGTHAVSNVTFDLAGECSRFSAVVGVDDSRGTRGSVQFQVFGDGEPLMEMTPLLTGASDPYPINLDITGVSQLSLRVTGGTDGVGSDHGNWALARVACGEVTPVEVDPKVTPSATTVAPGATVTLALTGYAPSESSSIAEVYVDGKRVGTATIDAEGKGSYALAVGSTEKALSVEVRQFGAGITAATHAGAATTVTVVKPVTPTTSPTPPYTYPKYPERMWMFPGFHDYGGRQWYTTCEPYGQTFRCWTYIWATQVQLIDGKYVRKADWYFNNLTYQPMPREYWGDNKFAKNNHWSEGGRDWYTECGTARTGPQACRTYIRASVIASTALPGGGYSYKWVTQWTFNHQVLFTN